MHHRGCIKVYEIDTAIPGGNCNNIFPDGCTGPKASGNRFFKLICKALIFFNYFFLADADPVKQVSIIGISNQFVFIDRGNSFDLLKRQSHYYRHICIIIQNQVVISVKKDGVSVYVINQV